MTKKLVAIIDKEKCSGCAICANMCPLQIIKIKDEKAVIDELSKCDGLGGCARMCPQNAIEMTQKDFPL